MPTEFNVSLLRGAPNPKAVFSSKAVGEPPLFLASSVFFAAKEAIRAARIERGLSKKFNMNAPATGTVIQNQLFRSEIQKFSYFIVFFNVIETRSVLLGLFIVGYLAV